MKNETPKTGSPQSEHAPLRCKGILATLTLAAVLVNIDQSGIGVLLHEISTDLDLSRARIVWLIAAFSLPIVALSVPLGELGDALGHRYLFVVGTAVFAIASCFAALSNAETSLIAARAIQGVGAAMMIPSARALIAQMYLGDALGPALGIFNAVGGLALAGAPVITGVIAALVSWRSFFLVHFALVVLFSPFLIQLLRHARPADADRRDLASVDWTASALLAICLTLISAGVIALGDKDFRFGIPALVLGGLLCVVRWRMIVARKHTTERTNLRRVRGALTATGITALIIGWGAIELPLYFGSVLGLGTLWTGIGILPLVLSLFAGRLLGGRLINGIGANPLQTGSLGVLFVALALAAFVVLSKNYWLVAPLLLMMGLGIGGAATAAATLALAGADANARGVISGLLVTVRRIGGLFGLVTIGALASMAASHVDSEPAAHTAIGLAICAVLAATAGLVAMLDHPTAESRAEISSKVD